MAYFNVPKDWTEKDCLNNIDEVMEEGFKRLKREKYDAAAQCFVAVARIIRSIPEVRRRNEAKVLINRKLKKELHRRGIKSEEQMEKFLEEENLEDQTREEQ